ncbi:MFS transporter [Clostridium sp. AF19-22AC]|uniref:MFS transporter n=2 Tax=Clostridia TaxID=186801 RepID=UPI000E4D000A|nr:glycoside-pentoside-hexuronide (GPH):cation symporter [Faecalicatena orotica]RHR26239.1 MFS transporter [Clostridium sp. AF19-22AC]
MGNASKLTFKNRLGYGLGELPGTMNSILAAFLTMFYTDNVGMAAGAVGTMFFISKLFDGITDLIAGCLIDKTKTKWGKARPWLLWLSVPIGLSAILIFMVPQNASGTAKMIYAFVTYNLFTSILYTLVGVAKAALMPLMTQDGVQRGALAKYSLIFGLGGAILGTAATFPLINLFGGDITAWRILFTIYGAVTTIGLLLAFAFTKENVQSVESVVKKDTEEKMSFTEGIKNFFQNKYFIFALAMTIVVNFSVQINSSSQTYFYTYAMNDAMLMTSLSMVSLIPTVLGIVFLAGPSLKFFGKKRSVYVGAAGQIVGYVLRGIAVSATNIPLLVAGTIICGLATGPLSVPVNTLSADAVDYGEYLTNKRIEGIGSAVVSFSQKVCSGLAAGCVGWILALTGYVANGVQSQATIFGITAMFAWLPAIMLIVVIICFKFIYHYDKEEPVVMAELEKRKKENSK